MPNQLTPIINDNSLFKQLSDVGFGKGIRDAFLVFSNVRKQQQSETEYNNYKNTVNELFVKAKNRFEQKRNKDWTEEDYQAVNDTVKDIALSGAPQELWKPTAQILLDINEENAKRYNLKSRKSNTSGTNFGQQESLPEKIGKGDAQLFNIPIQFTDTEGNVKKDIITNEKIQNGEYYVPLDEFSNVPYEQVTTLTKYKSDKTPRELYKINPDGSRTPVYLQQDVPGFYQLTDSKLNNYKEKEAFKNSLQTDLFFKKLKANEEKEGRTRDAKQAIYVKNFLDKELANIPNLAAKQKIIESNKQEVEKTLNKFSGWWSKYDSKEEAYADAYEDVKQDVISGTESSAFHEFMIGQGQLGVYQQVRNHVVSQLQFLQEASKVAKAQYDIENGVGSPRNPDNKPNATPKKGKTLQDYQNEQSNKLIDALK